MSTVVGEVVKAFEECALMTGHKTYEPTGAVIVGFMLRIPPGSPHLQVLEKSGLLDLCEVVSEEQLGEVI